jgi:alpha-1,2-mannosyltransferase
MSLADAISATNCARSGFSATYCPCLSVALADMKFCGAVSSPNWKTIAVLAFGGSAIALLLDTLAANTLAKFPAGNTLRTAIIIFFERSADSWEPMLKALAVHYGENWNKIYEAVFFDEAVKFQYPPTSLFYVEILDVVGVGGLRTLNRINLLLFLANAVVVGAIADICARRSTSFRPENMSRLGPILFAVAATLTFYPLTKAVQLGQIQIWIDLAFSLSILFWLLGKTDVSGALLGFAATIKPQFGLVILWALLWRDWKFFRGFSIVFLSLALLSLGHYGIENHLSYLKVLNFISERGESYFPNNSINGIANRFLFNGNPFWSPDEFPPPHIAVRWLTRVGFVLFLAFGLMRAFFRRGDKATVFDLGAVTLCSVMASPVAWEHHYGVAMPLFVIAFFALYNMPSRSCVLVLGFWLAWNLSANFLQAIEALGFTYLNILQAHLFFGCVWLVWFLGTQQNDANHRFEAIR